MEKNNLKVGVVGWSGIARIIHLPTLTKQSNVNVPAVCDIDIRKATILAKKYSIEHVSADVVEIDLRISGKRSGSS